MAMTYFASPFEQEDAIQEAFALLFRRREAIDPMRADSVASFILTLARRRMIDLLRARKVEPLPEELGEEELVDEEPDPTQRVADRELTELFERFERRLKPAHRAFFHAVFVEGRDFDEARAALGLGALRAKYLKSVLLRRLRQHRPLLEHLGLRGLP